MTIHDLEMYQSLYPDADVIRWNEVYGNKKFHKIKPEMLTDEGMAQPYTSRLIGETHENAAVNRLVIFDRHYAIAKLSADLRLIIESLDIDSFRDLIMEVYDYE